MSTMLPESLILPAGNRELVTDVKHPAQSTKFSETGWWGKKQSQLAIYFTIKSLHLLSLRGEAY